MIDTLCTICTIIYLRIDMFQVFLLCLIMFQNETEEE